MAITVVQKAGLGQGAAVSSQGSGNFTNNTVAGNMLIGICFAENATANRTVSSVTGGGTFQSAVSASWTNITSAWGDLFVYFAPNIAGGTKTAVTFNLSGTEVDIDVGCLEVSGVNTLDQTNTHNNVTNANPSTVINTSSITPTVNDSLVVAVWNSGDVITWGSGPGGYSNQFQDTGSTFEAGSVDTIILTSASAQNPSWTLTHSTTVGACACIASFINSGTATTYFPVHFAGARKQFLFLEETPFRSRHAKRQARRARAMLAA